MTKQDDIRQGIQEIIDGYDSTLPIDDPCPHCVVVDNILSYLHSQGVVIRVERELPGNPYLSRGMMKSYQYTGFERAIKDMAGFVAVEPLIKEEGK